MTTPSQSASQAATQGYSEAALLALLYPSRLRRPCLPLRVPLALPPVPTGHEAYLEAIRSYAMTRLAPFPDASALVEGARLTYGGLHTFRGITVNRAWLQGHGKVDYINISAAGEDSPLQLFGTCLHELAHVLAGCIHGHDNKWKQACRALGLVDAEASGLFYDSKAFDAPAWAAYLALPQPTDGVPRLNAIGGKTPRCSVGFGTRGGRSRGKGSGSRNRLWVCACAPPRRIRLAGDGEDICCRRCKADFTEKET